MTMHNDYSSEADLVALLKAQDSMALEMIKNKYGNVLWTIITRMLPNEDPEEIFKEVFQRIWCSVKEYDANNGRFFTWVTTMTRNFCLSKVDGLRDGNAIVKVIHANNNGLSTAQGVFDLLFFEGYSYTDIAQRFNLPVETVKVWIRETIMELRKLDANDFESPPL